MPKTFPCAGGCSRRLDAKGCRPCAILICRECRKDPMRFRNARSRFVKHINQHIKAGRQDNPWYPFNSFEEAFQYA